MYCSSIVRLARPHWPFLLLLAIVFPLLWIRLPQFPATWYDEGLNLNTARSLATSGEYALTSADPPRVSDPAIQTGPPLILIIALLYKLFGASLLVARLCMTLLGLLTLTALYALVTRLYNSLAAFLTILMLILFPGNDTGNFILLSRQVLGEVPAILCLCLGLHVMLAPQSSVRRTLLAGIFFGLAIELKSQVFVIVTVTVAIWLIYCVLRRSEWRRWSIVFGVMIVMYAVDWLWRTSMSGPLFASNNEILREGIFIHILPFLAWQNLGSFSTVASAGIMVFAVSLSLLTRRTLSSTSPIANRNSEIEEFITLLVTIWGIWYLLISIGWQRYSFVGEVFALILLGGALTRLMASRHWTIANWGYIALAVVSFFITFAYYLPRFDNPTGDDFFAMIDYLKKNVTANARIVSWEWSAGYMTDPQQFIYPTTHVVNVLTREIFLNVPAVPHLFDALAECPDYLLLGSFQLDRKQMKPALDIGTPVFASGQYELYTISPDKLKRLANGSCEAKDVISP